MDKSNIDIKINLSHEENNIFFEGKSSKVNNESNKVKVNEIFNKQNNNNCNNPEINVDKKNIETQNNNDKEIKNITNNSEDNKNCIITNCINEKDNLENIIQKIEDKEKNIEKNNSSKNLYSLNNLFTDYVNRFNLNESISNGNKRRKSFLTESTINYNIPLKSNSFNFHHTINTKLNEIKKKSLLFLERTREILDKKYNDYIQKINDYINKNEEKILNILPGFESNQNFLDYMNKNLFKQIENLFEIHESIILTLEDNYNLLFLFLEQNYLIHQKKPLENFLNYNSNDIMNSWFLNKINFDKIDLSEIIKNKDLSDLCIGYFCKKKEKTFTKISISNISEFNFNLETEFFRDNLNSLKKIKFIGLQNKDIIKFLKICENKSKNENDLTKKSSKIAEKLIALNIEDCDFISHIYPKFFLTKLQKITIKKSKIPINYMLDIIFYKTDSIREITLEKIKMNDKSLIIFFSFLSNNLSIQDSLHQISFKGNFLTLINLKTFTFGKCMLKNLEFLDLSKNNIYEFISDNFKILPKVRVLDLTDNNISNYLLFDFVQKNQKHIRGLVLLSNNIFVHNNRETNRKYLDYIYNSLISFKYKIKKISLSLLYNRDNSEFLSKLRMSSSVKITLIKLDLSFCGLRDETVWKFFKSNLGLLSLESLNISNNFITDNFFNLCLDKDTKLEKLKIVDLSSNNIICNNLNILRDLNKFIYIHQNLRKIKMQDTLFVQGLRLLVKEKKEETEKIIGQFINKKLRFVVETDLNGIVSDIDIFLYKNKIS